MTYFIYKSFKHNQKAFMLKILPIPYIIYYLMSSMFSLALIILFLFFCSLFFLVKFQNMAHALHLLDILWSLFNLYTSSSFFFILANCLPNKQAHLICRVFLYSGLCWLHLAKSLICGVFVCFLKISSKI